MLNDYPLYKFALIYTMFNPINLSKVFILLEIDVSAPLRYSGAAFKQFFGTNLFFYFVRRVGSLGLDCRM
jgi:Cu-processing system permease protein